MEALTCVIDGEVRLFKSKNPEYKDGMQLRDFIYVKDAVRCIFHLLESTNKSGLYNIGTVHQYLHRLHSY